MSTLDATADDAAPRPASSALSAAAAGVAARLRRAMVVVDMAESVRLLEHHADATIAMWRTFIAEIEQEVLPPRRGRLVKSLGDGMLLAFETVPEALAAAQQIQQRCARHASASDADAAVRLRIGINVADVVMDERDAFGAGVNVAARVATLADPGSIVLTADANQELLPGLDVETEDLGDCWFKHMAAPVRCFKVSESVPGPSSAELARQHEADLRPTLAVFPFDSEGEPDAALALGQLLADDLICACSALPELRVVSRLSTGALALRGDVLEQAAPLLNADYAVVGRCRALGQDVVVHAQCVHLRSGEVLLAERLHATVPALLAAHNPVVAQLVQAIGQALLQRHVEQARRFALPNISSFGLLAGGIALMHRLSRHDFARARQLLEHLAERWPRLAVVHAWIGRWHLFNVMQGWSADPAADRRAALQACDRALQIDAESSVALAVSGSVQVGLLRDVEAALALYQAALRANPSDGFAWMLLGTAHAFKGEGAAAWPASQQSIRLSPLDPMHFMYDCHAAGAALAADDAPTARTLAERSLRGNAQHLSSYRVLAIAQMLCADAAAARTTVARLLKLDPAQSVAAYLRASPAANYPIGQRFAQVLSEAGLPAGH